MVSFQLEFIFFTLCYLAHDTILFKNELIDLITLKSLAKGANQRNYSEFFLNVMADESIKRIQGIWEINDALIGINLKILSLTRTLLALW